MKLDELDGVMRAGECYHSIRLPADCYAVLRLDGRSFTKLTSEAYSKPFDGAFHARMVDTASAVMTDLNGLLGTCHSDEISILLPRNWDLFSREVEKTVSVAAGVASAVFSQLGGSRGVFDARLWVGDSSQVPTYFRWRQADALRGSLNSWAYYMLLKEGYSPAKATATLHGRGRDFKNELLFEAGVNYNDVEAWQKRGSMLTWTQYPHTGFNPITQETVPTWRRRIVIENDPLEGVGLDGLIRNHMVAAEAS